MIAFHCDREGCDSWISSDIDIPTNFVFLCALPTGSPIAHFCGLNCLMHWAAEKSVPTDAREIT
jgi:hypothetical protein